MKPCKRPSGATARAGARLHSGLGAPLLGVLALVSSSTACLEDEALDETEGAAAGAAGARSSDGGSAGRRQADDGEGEDTGGAGVSSGRGAAGSDAGEDSTQDGEDSMTPGDGAAEGETGIFVGMTAAHNAARAELDVDPPLPPLEWSPEIAEFAQQWSDSLAEQCGSIMHRNQQMFGENIAISGTSGASTPFAPEEAVAGWVAEVACWDYGTINGTERCDQQCATELFSNGCGHYTQVVWRDTERVGCGYSTCDDGELSWQIWVCNYDPPGNYVGQTPY